MTKKRPSVKVVTVTTTTQRHEISLSNVDIVRLLQANGHDVPDDASIVVHIPGGGDWSHTDLPIGDDSNVIVAWVTEETERTP